MKLANLTAIFLAHNRAELNSKILAEAQEHCQRVILLLDEAKGLTENHEPYLVVRHQLENDFATHRNIALENVSTKWALYLDADEIPEKNFWVELEKELPDSPYDAYYLPRRTRWLGKILRYGETRNAKFIRLSRTALGENTWQRRVHEVWQPRTEKIGELQVGVIHEQREDITAFLKKLDWYTTLESQERQRSKRQAIVEFFIYPPAKFLQNYFFKLGFLDGFPGLALAFLMAIHSAELRVKWYENS